LLEDGREIERLKASGGKEAAKGDECALLRKQLSEAAQAAEALALQLREHASPK
jgi:hypothetical protein